MSINYINLKELFQKPNKCYEIEIESKIEKVKTKEEFLYVDIINGNNYYKNFYLLKGEIFPEPSCGNLIIIKKIFYKFDENFEPKLFINILMSKKNENDFKNITTNDDINSINKLDFSDEEIKKTLLKFLDIKQELDSNLFSVNSVNEKYYSLELFKKNKTYVLEKKCDFLDYNLKVKDIIYIKDFYFEENKIKLSQISLIEKLSEEKLFILLEKNKELSEGYLWGKIIEKDKKNKIIRIMNNNKNILTIENYNNNIKLGQYFIFSKYIMHNDTIKLEEDQYDSFCYYSSEELYYSNKIDLNLFSAIQFYFIDFNNDNNYYKKISVENRYYIEIKKEKIIMVFDYTTYSKNKLIPIEISLIDKYSQTKNFVSEIFQGLLNKVNIFINNDQFPTYFFEYLYTYFKKPKNILDSTKTIEYYEMNYTINEFDNFDSDNRVRFNILNIPMQKDCEKNVKKGLIDLGNSILVCETFNNESERNIYGIFSIKQIRLNISLSLPLFKANYKSYYPLVGGIYDQIKNNMINDDDKLIELINKIELFKSNYSSIINKCLTINEEISICELKSRMGLLICSYFMMYSRKKKFRRLLTLKYIRHVIKRLELIKDRLTNSQQLRIFSYLLRAKINYQLETEIIFLSEEKEDSAYLLAQNFILEEINSINEFSKLFQGYLQMDSYVLKNYAIGEYSYSLSIEPIFILKYHLKSNYEGFFILEELNCAILGWTEPIENITIINENYLFQKFEQNDPSHISNEKDLKNGAFGISIVLRHENNSHKKKNLINTFNNSPLYYCNDGKLIDIRIKNPILKKGEDGIIIESLITEEQTIIISLARDFIYGELLDVKLFIQEDFHELLEKYNDIKSKKQKQLDDNKHQIDFKSITPMYNYSQNDEEQLTELALDVISVGILKIGNEIFNLDVIRSMVTFAQQNNSCDQLPPIFFCIKNELDRIQSKNYE